MKQDPYRRHGQKCIDTRIAGEIFSYSLQLAYTDAIDSHDSYLEGQNHTQYRKRNKEDIKSFIRSRILREMNVYLGSFIDDDKQNCIEDKHDSSFCISEKDS